MPTLLVLTYLLTVFLELGLSALNVRHQRRHGNVVPPEFADSIDASTLAKSSAYNADKEALGLLQTLFSAGVVLWFLFGSGLAAYDRWVGQLVTGKLIQGVVFFAGLTLASSLLELPFALYSTFRIEQRHGFNRTTVGLFFADLLKGTLLSLVLVGGITTAGLSLYYAAPGWYWLWFWGFGIGLVVLLMYVAPYVIEPLFIKTSPLTNDALAETVRDLSARAGVKLTRVMQSDASRRSAHSNAYFTGIGKVKRVVLFDTLLERLSDGEILAVLAHELGHWKLRHITKRLLTTALFALLSLYAASLLLDWNGFDVWMAQPGASVPAKLVLLAFLANLLGFVITPLSAFLSRRNEDQADAFASRLTGHPQDLAAALIKLARDNLTNLYPHPWYSAFYHSHPPTTARVRSLLQSLSGQ